MQYLMDKVARKGDRAFNKKAGISRLFYSPLYGLEIAYA
jgi:hypothetical protein